MAAPIEPPAERKTISVVGAAFLGLGAMVGAGIFALLGQAGAIAGSAVWLSFLIAGVIATLLGYAAAKLGVAFPVLGRADRVPDGGLRRGHVTGDRILAASTSPALIVTAMVAVSFGELRVGVVLRRRRRRAWANVLAVGGRRRDGRGERRRRRVGDQGAVGIIVDRAARRVRASSSWSPSPTLDPALLAPSTYPSAADDRGERGADLLRLPRLRGDQLHRRRPEGSAARAAARDVSRRRPDRRPLRAHLAGHVRRAHDGRGRALRRDRARPGRRAGARRGRLHDDVDRGAAGDLVVGQRQLVRRGEHHGAARPRRSSSRPSSAAARSAGRGVW